MKSEKLKVESEKWKVESENAPQARSKSYLRSGFLFLFGYVQSDKLSEVKQSRLPLGGKLSRQRLMRGYLR